MSDSPTWYDLLGVDQDATDADIRAAWKAGTADLEPCLLYTSDAADE